jgi:transcriptional regulator with XRE-family HTH domain
MSTRRQWIVRRGEDLGQALAEVRAARGLTQQQLADAAHVDRTYLARLEGGRSSRSLEHVLRALRQAGAEITVTWSIDDPDVGHD